MGPLRPAANGRPVIASLDDGGALAFALLVALTLTHGLGLMTACASPRVDPGLLSAVNAGGARVIVELRLDTPFVAEGKLPDPAAIAAQRRAINEAQSRLLSALRATPFSVTHRYTTTPLVALTIGPEALAILERRDDLVVQVTEDTQVSPPTPPRRPSPPTE